MQALFLSARKPYVFRLKHSLFWGDSVSLLESLVILDSLKPHYVLTAYALESVDIGILQGIAISFFFSWHVITSIHKAEDAARNEADTAHRNKHPCIGYRLSTFDAAKNAYEQDSGYHADYCANKLFHKNPLFLTILFFCGILSKGKEVYTVLKVTFLVQCPRDVGKVYEMTIYPLKMADGSYLPSPCNGCENCSGDSKCSDCIDSVFKMSLEDATMKSYSQPITPLPKPQ